MPIPSWTPEQVLLLAPDEASRKNASVLASPRKWAQLRFDDSHQPGVLWGECRGSSADPYRCQVDLGQTGFACSCPSRKRPCKHGLGLLLLFAGQPEAFEVSAPPDWVSAWMAKRAEQGERKAARQPGQTPEADAPVADMLAAGEAGRAKRAAARDQKIRAGLDDLEVWLRDLVRQGLAAAQTQPGAFWENAAARLVDAQAPGLARLVRGMASAAVSGDGWQERMADPLARLYLALQGYRRIDSLPEQHQADLRAVIGFTLRQEDLLEGTAGGFGVRDSWMVLGSISEEEAGLTTLRTWLAGRESGRLALVLSFATAGRALEMSFAPGAVLETELVFYPGAYPLRAVARAGGAMRPLSIADLSGLAICRTLREATAGYAAALAANPWLEHYPLLLAEASLSYDQGWLLCDESEHWQRIRPTFALNEEMLAISGGYPLNVFGEWNGFTIQPLSVWNQETYHVFRPAERDL